MKTLIGLKLNMSQIFLQDGTIIPTTYIDVKDVKVVGKKTKGKDGYDALVLGFGKKKNSNKSEKGKYKDLDFVPKYAVEADMDDFENFKIGDHIKPSLFELNKKVSVTGFTKGKGFQGVIKRWGFAGGPRTHGQSDRERHGGSIGERMTPGRVFKGQKMGGRMGNVRKTVKNLKVVVVDDEKGIVGVKGAVPGNQGSLVVIKLKQ